MQDVKARMSLHPCRAYPTQEPCGGAAGKRSKDLCTMLCLRQPESALPWPVSVSLMACLLKLLRGSLPRVQR